jgi:hypothetical protein
MGEIMGCPIVKDLMDNFRWIHKAEIMFNNNYYTMLNINI